MHQTLTVNWLLDATGGNGRTKATRVKYDVLATIGIRKKHKLDLDGAIGSYNQVYVYNQIVA